MYHIYLDQTLVPATVGAFLSGLLNSLFLRLHILLSVTEESPVQRPVDENN